jgi:uncharacterized membrane protein
MDKFIAIVFADESKASQGVKALEELDFDGSISLYGTAVIKRTKDGVATKEKRTEGPVGTALGAFVGGLVGMLGGPVGTGIGLAAGAVAGGARDLFELGMSQEYLDSFSRALAPGKVAVLAEISEEWVAPLDTRMAALGGTVMREPRSDFIEYDIHRRIEAHKADLAQGREERAAAKAERMEAKLEEDIKGAEEKLRRIGDKALSRVEQYKIELDARIKALRDQAAHASPAAKGRIEKRMAKVRADEEKRLHKLEEAWRISQDALRRV